MRVRTQLGVLVGAALAGVALTTLLVVAAARRDERAADAQMQAQITAHETTGLLTLTQEYTRYGEPRAAEQWYARQRRIVQTVALETLDGARTPPGAVPLAELRAAAAALPPLFSRLQEIDPSGDPFAERRQAALIDQLLTTTQAMSDFAYQWSQDVSEERARIAQQFRWIALATPLLMLAGLAVAAAMVQRRVLRPMARLEAAAAAVREGRLDVRLASTATDEFGHFARGFDAMTEALADNREKLSRSEKQLRDITDNLPALLGYIDADEVYRFVNAQYRTMFGAEPASLVGRKLADVLGPRAYASVRDELHGALRGERRSFERERLNNGVLGHLHIDYIPDIDDDGHGGKHVAGCYVMVMDITARKQAELELQRSEQRLADLMNSIPAMVGWFDMQERCRYANDSGLKSLGLERSDLPGLALRDALGESNYAQHEPYVQEALQGRRARLNGKIPFKGRTAYFQAHLIPDRVEGGAQRGFYMMTFDVTAMQEAQIKQAQTESRIRAISDNLPVLISYIDAERRFVFMNQTYRSWFGIDPAQVVGRSIEDVLGAERYEQRRENFDRALGGERVAFEMESEAGGTQRSLQTTYIPDIHPDGHVAGIYALSTDITSRKAVERELARLARSDALTGLPNRLLFDELMPAVIGRAKRASSDKGAIALMFLDVDHFKSINDTHGHAGGDAVLCEFAARLKRAVRVTDTVARIAGDEFVIALEGLHHPDEARHVARNVLAHVRRPFQVLGLELAVTTSIGITFHDPGAGPTTPAELLARADEALYAAKLAGRNGFHLSVHTSASMMGSFA